MRKFEDSDEETKESRCIIYQCKFINHDGGWHINLDYQNFVNEHYDTCGNQFCKNYCERLIQDYTYICETCDKYVSCKEEEL